MGIGEAMRCRQVRRTLSKPSSAPSPEVPEVGEPGSPGSASSPLSPSPGGAKRGTLLPGDEAIPKHLLFAPPGTTPAQEFPPTSYPGSNEEDNARLQRGNPVGGVVSINAGGSSSFQGALTTMKTGGLGFGRNILGRSLSTPERTTPTTRSIFSTAVAPSPPTVAPAHEGVPDIEEGFSPPHPRISKEAREVTVLRGASSETSGCGGEEGLSAQHYGSVEEKQPRPKAHKWMGSSRMARLREKLRGDDQAYGSIAEEEEDDDDVGEGEGGEWRTRVSKWIR